MTNVPPAWHTRSAAEERELCAIAQEALAEALMLGKVCRTFLGHRIRIDCWCTHRGVVMRYALDDQVLHKSFDWSTWPMGAVPTAELQDEGR